MKKHTKPLTALVLSLALLLAMVVPAMAQDNTDYNPLDSWENLTGDTGVTVLKHDIDETQPVWLFTSQEGNHARFEQVFKDVAPGAYELCFYGASTGITTEIFINGEKYTIPNSENYLTWYSYTVNVPTQRDVRVVVRFMGSGDMLLTGPLLNRSGDAQPEQPQPDNLLKNPGFEDTLDGWIQMGVKNTALEPLFSRSGFTSATLTYTAYEGLENYLMQTVAAGAGTYTGEIYAYAENGSLNGLGAMLMLEALDENGNVLATAVSPTSGNPDGVWQGITATLEAPAGTAKIAVKAGGIYSDGMIALDDALLTQTA